MPLLSFCQASGRIAFSVSELHWHSAYVPGHSSHEMAGQGPGRAAGQMGYAARSIGPPQSVASQNPSSGNLRLALLCDSKARLECLTHTPRVGPRSVSCLEDAPLLLHDRGHTYPIFEKQIHRSAQSGRTDRLQDRGCMGTLGITVPASEAFFQVSLHSVKSR